MEEQMEADLKSKLLKLLKEDEEFRYAIAGLIGLEDLRHSLVKLSEAMTRLEQTVEKLAKEQAKIWEEIKRLSMEHREFSEEQRRMSRTLRNVVSYIEEVSILLEDEARSMVEYRLNQYGVKVSLSFLIRPYAEFDIYGSNGDLTVIGEAKTRLVPRHVKEFMRKLDLLKSREPELIKGKVVKVIYALWIHPKALEECRMRGIWLNTPDKELTSLTA